MLEALGHVVVIIKWPRIRTITITTLIMITRRTVIMYMRVVRDYYFKSYTHRQFMARNPSPAPLTKTTDDDEGGLLIASYDRLTS